MPKRTTPFQMVVHLVRKHLATPDVVITESKGLPDIRLGIDREVDVVVEGAFDGDPVVTSMEVIDHARPANVTWVEQQVAKHRHLSTTRLILVSKSGFSKNALAAVAAEGGWVDAVRPEVVTVDGEPVVKRLFKDEIELKATICRLVIRRSDAEMVAARAFPDNIVFDAAGNELGNAAQLAGEALNLPWLKYNFAREAHDHPERTDLKGFTCAFADLTSLGYHLREEAGELHPILALELHGDFTFVQEELALTITDLANRRYGVGEASLLGRPTVWVGTTDMEAKTTTLSWSTKDGKPLFERPPTAAPRFPGLQTLPPPPERSVPPVGSDRGHG